MNTPARLYHIEMKKQKPEFPFSRLKHVAKLHILMHDGNTRPIGSDVSVNGII
jgi:hypothetical protein